MQQTLLAALQQTVQQWRILATELGHAPQSAGDLLRVVLVTVDRHPARKGFQEQGMVETQSAQGPNQVCQRQGSKQPHLTQGMVKNDEDQRIILNLQRSPGPRDVGQALWLKLPNTVLLLKQGAFTNREQDCDANVKPLKGAIHKTPTMVFYKGCKDR